MFDNNNHNLTDFNSESMRLLGKMKKIIAVCLFISLLIPVLSFAASKKASKGEPKPDEMQQMYFDTLRKNSEKLIKNYKEKYAVEERLDMYQVNKPLQLNLSLQEINHEISRLEQAREDLKMDALKYYKGKLPDWLETKWIGEESKPNEVHIELMQKKLGIK